MTAFNITTFEMKNAKSQGVEIRDVLFHGNGKSSRNFQGAVSLTIHHLSLSCFQFFYQSSGILRCPHTFPETHTGPRRETRNRKQETLRDSIHDHKITRIHMGTQNQYP